MSKDKFIKAFEIDLQNPGSLKSGEYLTEQVLKRAESLITEDRDGILEVCRYWLSTREEPHTILALRIIKAFGLNELRLELEHLGNDIEAGKVFLPFYKRWVDDALSTLE